MGAMTWAGKLSARQPSLFEMSIVNRIVSVAWQRLSKCFKKHTRADGRTDGRDELSRIRFPEHWGPGL